MSKFDQQVRTDRFGNPYILKTAHGVVTKDGQLMEGFYKGYFEQNGQLFKLEISPRNKETKKGDPAVWFKVTKVKKQQTNARF